MKCVILISTFSTMEKAKDISKKVISEKFAACVNIMPINSIYSWNNSIESSNEFLALFKTTDSNISKLRNFLLDEHDYDIPEIIDFELDNVNESYINFFILIG